MRPIGLHLFEVGLIKLDILKNNDVSHTKLLAASLARSFRFPAAFRIETVPNHFSKASEGIGISLWKSARGACGCDEFARMQECIHLRTRVDIKRWMEPESRCTAHGSASGGTSH